MVMFQYSIHQMQKESLSLLVNLDPQFLPTSWGTPDERLLSHKISSFMLCDTKETSYWTRTNFYSRRHIVRTNYGIKHNMIRTPFFVVSFPNIRGSQPIGSFKVSWSLYPTLPQIEMTYHLLGEHSWLLFDIDDHSGEWCGVPCKITGNFHSTI